MRKRLVLLRELLTNDGSIYVHLDYRRAHYVKILMDEIFGESNFQNEVTWRRQIVRGMKVYAEYMPHSADYILLYTKGPEAIWNRVEKENYLSIEEAEKKYMKDEKGYFRTSDRGTYSDESIIELYKKGRIYVTKGGELKINDGKVSTTKGKIGIKYYREQRGDKIVEKTVADNIWDDIPGMGIVSSEYIGFPTQKPEQLLERIIKASSNSGDIVLDCFAGSGTAGAVAEKLNRKWVMIDSSKFAIYTSQKRFLDLKSEIGRKGEPLKLKPFVLYNCGLYLDGDFIERMRSDDYAKFVMELFQVQPREHKINGLRMHGTLNNRPVYLFSKEDFLTKEFVDSLHNTVGTGLKDSMYIIAPQSVVRFNEDYIDKGDKRYYILRIPYSIIEEIRKKDFKRIEQPKSQDDINKTIEGVGFDFIYPPKVRCTYSRRKSKGKSSKEELVIEIEKFEPVQISKDPIEFDDPREDALSMVMIDRDYNGEYFDLDEYFFSDEIIDNNFKIRMPASKVGDKLMIIYLDILGNERKEVKSPDDFE